MCRPLFTPPAAASRLNASAPHALHSPGWRCIYCVPDPPAAAGPTTDATAADAAVDAAAAATRAADAASAAAAAVEAARPRACPAGVWDATPLYQPRPPPSPGPQAAAAPRAHARRLQQHRSGAKGVLQRGGAGGAAAPTSAARRGGARGARGARSARGGGGGGGAAGLFLGLGPSAERRHVRAAAEAEAADAGFHNGPNCSRHAAWRPPFNASERRGFCAGASDDTPPSAP